MMRPAQLRRFSAIGVAAVLALSGCVVHEAGSSELATEQRPAASYFGYALIDCGYDDPLDDASTTNYVAEIASFSNVAQLCVFAPTDAIGERLELMASHQVLAMLSVQEIFFEGTPDPTTGSGVRLDLRVDYLQRWKEFTSVNEGAIDASRVATLYLVDEPYWNGMSLGDLTVAADVVEQTFADIPTTIIEAWPALAELAVPESIDIVGFDHYAIADPATDSGYARELALLKSKRSAVGQRIMLVMDAQWLPLYAAAGLDEASMASVAKSYLRIAQNDPEIIAIVGYTWPGGLDDPQQKGTRQLPASVIAEHERIGKLVTGK